MKATYHHRLQPPEYGFLAISTVGTIAAAITQQVVYATVPLTLAMSLVLTKRQQFPQQTQQQTTEESADVCQIKQDINIIRQELDAIADVHQVKQDIDVITQELNTLSLRFNTRPESQQIDSLKEVIAQLLPQTKQFDPTPLILQLTELQQSVANFEASSVFDKMVQIQTDMQLLQENIDQKCQQDETLNKAVKQLQMRSQIVHLLSSEIGDLKRQQRQGWNQISNTQQQLQVLDIKFTNLHDDTQQIKQDGEKRQEQISLYQQNNSAEEEVVQHRLDNFEKLILNNLQEGLPRQRILPDFDAGIKSDNSKSIDFVVVMRNCIIAIEAKCYKGIIEPTGDPRNTKWTYRTGSENIPIKACYGENPYKQVKSYVNSILNRIEFRSQTQFRRLPVYGIVVFPNEAEIVSSIKSDLGNFYRVTTLNNLVDLINSIEKQAERQNESGMSYQNILDILLGPSHKKQIICTCFIKGQARCLTGTSNLYAA